MECFPTFWKILFGAVKDEVIQLVLGYLSRLSELSQDLPKSTMPNKILIGPNMMLLL